MFCQLQPHKLGKTFLSYTQEVSCVFVQKLTLGNKNSKIHKIVFAYNKYCCLLKRLRDYHWDELEIMSEPMVMDICGKIIFASYDWSTSRIKSQL